MKNSILTAFFTLILATSLLLGQDMGSITITSDPDSCWVKVDSVLVGRTPLEQFDLSEGSHLVHIYPPENGLWNINEKKLQINVIANVDSPIHASFAYPVFINSIPFGATLFSDTTRLGLTPVYLSYEENRNKEFRLEKDGYVPYLFTLTARKTILAEMERSSAEKFKDNEGQRFLGMISKQRVKSKFSLLALTVASHWASFYFKNLADDRFDKYEAAADPAVSQNYWDQTQRFDLLSEITLGISYASLAGFIYMVVWK